MLNGRHKEDITAMVAEGMTMREIADDLGVSYDNVRMRLYRAGCRAKHEAALTIRDKAEVMPLREAVDYLLACVESLASVFDPCKHHDFDGWGMKVTPSQRRILIAMDHANGRVVTKESLLDAMALASNNDTPGAKVVDVQICKLRKQVPADKARIETVWGVGYRLVRTTQ